MCVAARGLAVDAEHDGAVVDGRAVETEAGQAGEPGRLQHQAGAERARLGEALEQADVVAVARQECRGSEAGGARSCDGYAERGHESPPGYPESLDQHCMPEACADQHLRAGACGALDPGDEHRDDGLSTRAPWAGCS